MPDTIAVSGLACEPHTACNGGMPTSPDIAVDREPLTRDEVVAVVRHGARARLTAKARKSVAEGRERVRALAAGPDPAYGVSTGFGALATRHIEPELRDRLQRSLVRSHAAGAGAEWGVRYTPAR